jgi:uroporphyrinogen-III synthase
MHALITRPLEDAKPLADLLAARGVDCIVEPLLEIVPHDDAVIELDGVQALLFTSANGVRAFAAHSPRRDIGVLTVGEGSAEAARAAGFKNVMAAGGDVDALVRLVQERLDPKAGPLFHGAGSALAGDLQGKLEQAHFTLRRTVLYEAKTATAFSPEARMNLALGGIDMVLLFSPRTARTFVSLWEAAEKPSLVKTTALCLSDAVAREVNDIGWQRVKVAARPDQPSMLALVEAEIARRDAATGEITKPLEPPAPLQSEPAMASAEPKAAEATTPAQETAARSSAEEPPAPVREAPMRESTAQESITRESAMPESAMPESATQESATRESARQESARRGSTGFASIIAGLIAGAVAGAAVVATGPYWQPLIGMPGPRTASAPEQPAPDLGPIEARLDALEKAKNSGGSGATQEQVDAAVRAATERLDQEIAPLADRVGKLEQESGAPPDLLPLLNRIAKLEQQQSAAASAPAAPDLTGDVTAMKATNDTLAQQLKAAQDQIAALQAKQASLDGTVSKLAAQPPAVTAEQQRDTALVLALSELRGALAVDKPYGARLQAIDALTGDDAALKAKLGATLDPLRPLSERGAPTLAQLQASLPSAAIAKAANSESAAKAVGADQGWSERLINRLSEAVTIRPVGADIEGEGPLPRLARAEARLKSGDLAAAVSELEGLQGKPAEVAKPWLDSAKARLAQDQAGAALDETATALLAPKSGE